MDQFPEMWWISDCGTLSLVVSSAIFLLGGLSHFDLE